MEADSDGKYLSIRGGKDSVIGKVTRIHVVTKDV